MRSMAVFVDAARKLPEMARTLKAAIGITLYAKTSTRRPINPSPVAREIFTTCAGP